MYAHLSAGSARIVGTYALVCLQDDTAQDYNPDDYSSQDLALTTPFAVAVAGPASGPSLPPSPDTAVLSATSAESSQDIPTRRLHQFPGHSEAQIERRKHHSEHGRVPQHLNSTQQPGNFHVFLSGLCTLPWDGWMSLHAQVAETWHDSCCVKGIR